VGLAWSGSLGFSIMREHGGSVLAGMWREREVKKQNFSFFPCCTFRGRRKRNSVVQNNTVLVLFSLSFFLT
jgi:hypothetical protein